MSYRIRIAWGLWTAAVIAALSACSDGATVVGIEQSGGAVGPQRIEDATEVLRFDPASIAPGDDAPVSGACVASSAVPGAYRCDLQAGGAAEPCFALDATRLLCDPDPVTGGYAVLVAPTDTLPSVAPPSPDRAMPFFVELDGGLTCAVHTGPEPVIIGGVAARYECGEPYTYLLGEGNPPFSRDAPLWGASLYTLDPATGESPSGKVPVDVLRVWIP